MRTLFIVLALCLALPLQAADAYKKITWEALVPKGWDPAQDLRALLRSGKLQDSDPRAMEALEKMKVLWDSAPTEASLAGMRVRLAGFAIPLEVKDNKATEFLLVPYFGACIHSPPPPANQIIHAISAKPLKGMRIMDAVWVSGTLSLHRADTPWGKAGYRLAVDKIGPYEEPKKK
ncbi:MAG: DUF3299 domain-containing protein [Sulfuritalea sp.]|jgi:hypothetical protein|nr:DUF3299 domain-containing protein [Sulfuritalea sp.]